jgi:hypothetical protein
MTERTGAGDRESGVRLTREVLRALPPLSREDEAMAAVIEGMLVAAELLQEDDIETTER